MAESDSDWDSTLDFTSPRGTSGPKIPKMDGTDVEDDELSQINSQAENKPKPADRFSVVNTNSNGSNRGDGHHPVNQNDIYATVQKHRSHPSTPQNQRKPKESPPPYNFRNALKGETTPEPQRLRPGMDRKENIYDVVASPSPVPDSGITPRNPGGDSIRSTNSWDDSDPDERTLRELRETFSKEKKKETEAEELKLKLQRAAEQEREDGMMTNRSETTWKSWAGGVGKKNDPKKKNKKKSNDAMLTARSVKSTRDIKATLRVETPRQLQSSASFPRGLNEVQNIQVPVPATANREVKNELQNEEPVKDIPLDMPAYVDPPYIIKDEDGRSVFYFGHGSLQYYEVDDEASEAFLPRIAEKAEKVVQRVYQEVFGFFRIISSIVLLFIIELLKYLIKYIIQPIMVGVLETLGDYIVKPALTIVFNGFIHPLGVFMWNMFMALRHMFGPIGDILKKVFTQLAMLCRSIRLVEIHWNSHDSHRKTDIV